MREVRVTFRLPDSRNELADVHSWAYSMVVTIFGWTWWVLYFIPCYCAAEGPLVGGSTQGEEQELNNYCDEQQLSVFKTVHDPIKLRVSC